MLSIGLRYCGGCNPQVDRSRIVREIKEGLRNRGLEFCFSTDKDGIFDLFLLINGCRHACIEEDYSLTKRSVNMISVKGDMVDDFYLQEEDITRYLIDKIMTQCNAMTL